MLIFSYSEVHDETTIQVLDRNKKKDTHQGYYWTYLTHNGQLIYFDYHRGGIHWQPNISYNILRVTCR
ncbi:IS66 family transposase [Paraflavitalea speifideaquila]|uniref:IS66 family transposase n=1 Tax=Paraflavitalea speifideaquila TaxID=3076558 RepID=UPI003312F839